jgi:hypothetical protein
MTNLTITVDEGTLKRARMRALEEDTSVNAVLREYCNPPRRCGTHPGCVKGNVPVSGGVLPWIRAQASESLCCLEGEPEFRHVFRAIQPSPGQFFDATHPVDEGLFVDVECGCGALPGTVLREEHLERGG